MTPDYELIKKRFIELARKSASGSYYIFTDFLGLAEQSIFNDARASFGKVRYTLFGGAEGTERVMVRFGDPEELGYEEDFPISIIKVAPRAQKFADKLSHRDFLGAILNLGIERKLIGDIAIIENVGFIFAKSDIADYISSSLERVKHTDVSSTVIDSLPEGDLYRTETVTVQLSGERLDAVISKLFGISRDDSLSLFKKGLVFVSGKLTPNNSYTPKVNDVISVRGFGRFIYRGVTGTSRKGKLNVLIERYV